MARCFFRALCLLCVLAGLLIAARRADAQIVVDFNTPGDFTSTNFNFSASSALWYAEADGVGVDGSRALRIIPSGGTDVSATYKNAVADFSTFGSVFETSLLFKKDAAATAASSRVLDLGALPSDLHFLNGSLLAMVRLRSTATDAMTLQFQNNTTSVLTSSAVTLTDGNFYKLNLKLTNIDGVSVGYNTWLDDYGSAGSSLLSTGLAAISGTVANSTLATDASLYTGFRIRNENNSRAVEVIDNLSLTSVSGTGSRPDREFSHPGMLNDAREMAYFSAMAAGNVGLWSQGWNRIANGKDFANQPLLSHRPQATAGYGAYPHWSSPGVPRDLLDDARAAYAAALAWKVTGDPAHAAQARGILNAWSSTLTTIYNNASQPMTPSDSRQDYMLYTSYSWPAMIWAAEILRGDASSGFTSADQAAFGQLLQNVVRPAAEHASNNLQNNWASWRICYKMSDAIYTNDTTRFYESLEEYRTLATNFLGNLQGEMGRDLWHSQMSIAPLIATAEMALKQGVDLYSYSDNLLLRVVEYQAPFVREDFTHWPLATDPDMGAQFDGSTVWTFYEMVYNHYHNRLGIDTPETLTMLNAIVKQFPNEPFGTVWDADGGRPYRAEDFHRIGYGTLTHAGNPVAYRILAGFDPQQDLLTDMGMTVTGPTGVAQIVSEPTAGQTRNGVLRLDDPSAGAMAVQRLIAMDELVDVWLDYRFFTEGTLRILIDGVLVESIDAPATGLGRDSYEQYRKSFTLSSLGLLDGGEHLFALRFEGAAGRRLWLDNLVVTTAPNIVPEPATAAILGLGATALLRRRRR